MGALSDVTAAWQVASDSEAALKRRREGCTRARFIAPLIFAANGLSAAGWATVLLALRLLPRSDG